MSKEIKLLKENIAVLYGDPKKLSVGKLIYELCDHVKYYTGADVEDDFSLCTFTELFNETKYKTPNYQNFLLNDLLRSIDQQSNKEYYEKQLSSYLKKMDLVFSACWRTRYNAHPNIYEKSIEQMETFVENSNIRKTLKNDAKNLVPMVYNLYATLYSQ